jgi:hypothetical protein
MVVRMPTEHQPSASDDTEAGSRRRVRRVGCRRSDDRELLEFRLGQAHQFARPTVIA